MDNLVVYILVTLLSGAIGAGIGTYLGSHFSAQKQERRNKEIRNIAIKALNIIKKYSGKGNTYDMAEADFNTSLSVAEKRIFMVSLHKLGIPILYFQDRSAIISSPPSPSERSGEGEGGDEMR